MTTERHATFLYDERSFLWILAHRDQRCRPRYYNPDNNTKTSWKQTHQSILNTKESHRKAGDLRSKLQGGAGSAQMVSHMAEHTKLSDKEREYLLEQSSKLWKEGQPDRAIDCCNKILESDPNDSEVKRQRDQMTVAAPWIRQGPPPPVLERHSVDPATARAMLESIGTKQEKKEARERRND